METRAAEFGRAWRVIVAAAVGVGLGVTGLPIYTTGQFVRPLQEAFGWTRAQSTGGLIYLTIGSVLMAPVIGALIERFGVRRVALVAQLGLCIGYFGLTLNGGSVPLYYLGWAVLAILGSGTSPIVWTRAVASWFERGRGLALGITLCGTGLVALVGPSIIGGIVTTYGWQAGFYTLSGAQIVLGMPLTLLLLRSRDRTEPHAAATVLTGMTLREAAGTTQFWKLIVAFYLISVVVGGLIVHLTPMLGDMGMPQLRVGRMLGFLGFAIITGRLTIGALVDRFSATVVAPIYICLPVLSCFLLADGTQPVMSILLIGLSAGAEVDLLAFLMSKYFGMKHYAKIYGWGLSAFSAGAGSGPILAGWVHDETGSYRLALYAFAALMIVGAALIGSLGRLRTVLAKPVLA